MMPKSISEPPKSEDVVRRVYGQHRGWSMFDARYLTDDVKDFLVHENQNLREFLTDHPGVSHLVEAGCGYGRFLKLALALDVAYDGLDIVSWLTRMAELRIATLRERHPRAHMGIHLVSIASPAKEFPIPPPGQPCTCGRLACRRAILMPFNLLGNVPDLEATLANLRRTEADVLVSTFATGPETSLARLKYYENCGFNQLAVEDTAEGVLVTSREGLRTYAYRANFLCDLFATHGFSLVETFDNGDHGHLFWFRLEEAPS